MNTYQKVTDYISTTSIPYKCTSDGEQAIIHCPFCQDDKWHLYIKNTDGCFLCHKCGAKGSWKNLLENLGITEPVSLESHKSNTQVEYRAKLKTTTLDPSLVDQYHTQIPDRIVTYLKEERGLTDESITKFKIGWDGKSITIPVFDHEGKLINIRHRRDPKKNDGNKMWNEPGGKAALFNISAIEEANQNNTGLLIGEGEFDAIVATQHGFPAVTGTAGANTFKKEWLKHFEGISPIYICYDTDQVGNEGAEKVAVLFGKRAKIVFLPQISDGKVDISNFFIQQGKSASEFQKLLDEAKEYAVKPKDFEILESELQNAIHPALDYYDDKLFVGIPLSVEVKSERGVRIVIITSDKEKTLVDDDVIILPNQSLPVRKVARVPKKTTRWDTKSIQEYLKAEGKVALSLAFLEIQQALLKFVDFRNETDADVITLWIMGTYLFPIFDAFPYLYLVGVKRSGKTKTLLLIDKLAFNAILSSNISPSVLFRIVEATRCTLSLDESEQLADKNAKQELRELLNSGYKQGAPAYRNKKDKDGNFEFETFEIYSPKAIANINGLDNVLEDRSITVTMVRTNNPEKGNLAVTGTSENWNHLRALLYTFALDHAKEISEIYNFNPDVNALMNRQNELWRPLLSIAKLVDKEIPGTFDHMREEALRRSQEVSGSDLEDFDSAVLLALRELIDNKESKTFANKEIREKALDFLEDDQRLYFTSRGVGAALKRFGIPGKKIQGYWRYTVTQDTITELMKRYGIDTTVDIQ